MNRTHGYTGTPTFKSWGAMKQRCMNPKAPDYARFGGRGITICQSWKHSFENFLADMGERPSGTTLDRINVNGNYTPDNCQWSTPKEQMRNRRNTRRIKYKGKFVPLIELAERHGLRVQVLVARLGSGWPIHRAITQPLTEGRGKKKPAFP